MTRKKADTLLLEQCREGVQEAMAQIVINRKVIELGSEFARSGPRVRLKPGTHGYIKVEEAVLWFRRGYAAAISHFVDGLSGDFAGLEDALKEQELDVSTSAGAFWDELCPDETLVEADGGEC